MGVNSQMPELEQQPFQKRQVAYKVRIADILNGSFVKDDTSAGYVKVGINNVSRVNIIATLIYKAATPYSSAGIDDGTGRIPLRSFENNNIFSNVDIGDVVLMIGKIREFNNEKYIVPNILKKINNIEWLNVRKLELMEKNKVDGGIKVVANSVIEKIDINIDEDIYSLIKKLDKGDGVSVDDVIKSSNIHEAENIINKLLESGDIFEIKPGKLKVLE